MIRHGITLGGMGRPRLNAALFIIIMTLIIIILISNSFSFELAVYNYCLFKLVAILTSDLHDFGGKVRTERAGLDDVIK